MWVDPDDDPRETGAATIDERSTLLDYLHRYRLTMEMKCADLDVNELAAVRCHRRRCRCSDWCGT